MNGGFVELPATRRLALHARIGPDLKDRLLDLFETIHDRLPDPVMRANLINTLAVLDTFLFGKKQALELTGMYQ